MIHSTYHTHTHTPSSQAFVSDGSGNALSRTSTATVAVTVEDVNDNSPVLENPHAAPIELLEVSWY